MNYLILSVLMLFAMPVYSEVKVLAFSGSLREESYNKSLAKEAVKMANNSGASATFIDLRDIPMPFYDGDLEENEGLPENAKLLKKKIAESDLIIITSPIYNGSFSGVLKNTIDWISRSEAGGDGRSVFEGKKLIIMCTTPGKNASYGLTHLNDVVKNCGAEMNIATFAIPSAESAFDKQGNLIDPNMKTALNSIIIQGMNR